MEDNIEELLRQGKEYCDNNSYASFFTYLKILDALHSKDENTKYDIISKIFLYPNQLNYVKISLIHTLLENSSFINNEITKRKYYQLLIESFSKGRDQEYQPQIKQIRKLFEKSKLNNNYIDLDKYIQKLYNEQLSKSNIVSDTMNSSMNGESSIINLATKPNILIDDEMIQNKEHNFFEEISSENNADISSIIQDTKSNLKKKK